MNELLENPDARIDLQFEICEKPVVKLPNNFQNKSIVVMDGPFFCIDPFGESGNYVLGNVEHAIHQRNIGMYPIIDKKFESILNNGIVKTPFTKFAKFIESAKDYIPDIEKAEHIGSMFTIRTVLPNLEKTHARPTIVSEIQENTITVFSGKIGNCVQAAEEVLDKIKNDKTKL